MTTGIAVLLFRHEAPPRTLRGLDQIALDQAFGAALDYRRVVVVGSHADLAAVLTRMLRMDRLDVEVAHVARWWQGRRARTGVATRVPLIRDETGTVVTRAAYWRPADEAATLRGEVVVDDTVLFDGEVAGVRVEPTGTMPGLRAAVLSPAGRHGRWVPGRAAQLGATGARVIRDGVPAPRPVKRSTFYRHTEGWLRVG